MSDPEDGFIPPPPMAGRPVAPPPAFVPSPQPVETPPEPEAPAAGETTEELDPDLEETRDAGSFVLPEPEPELDPELDPEPEPEPDPEPEPEPESPAASTELVTVPLVVAPPVEASPVEASPAEPRPPRRRRGLRGLVIGLAAAVVVLGGAAAGYFALAATYTPEHAAAGFLDEVVSRDAAALVARFDFADDEAALLTPAIIDDLGEAVDSYEVVGSTVDGDTATVDVVLHAGPATIPETLQLVRQSRVLLFDVWGVRNPLAQVRASATGPDGYSVVVNGVDLKTAPGETVESYVIPGVYEVAATDEPFVAPQSSRVAVPGFSVAVSDQSDFIAELSDEGVAAADAAVDEYLANCTASTSPNPPSECYFGGFDDPSIQSVSWSLQTRPVARFQSWDPDFGGWPAAPVSSGVIAVSGHGSDEFGPYDFSLTIDPYDLFGVVRFAGDGTLVYAP